MSEQEKPSEQSKQESRLEQRMALYKLVRTELQDLNRTPVEREYLFDVYFSLERELFDVDATNDGSTLDAIPYALGRAS